MSLDNVSELIGLLSRKQWLTLCQVRRTEVRRRLNVNSSSHVVDTSLVDLDDDVTEQPLNVDERGSAVDHDIQSDGKVRHS